MLRDVSQEGEYCIYIFPLLDTPVGFSINRVVYSKLTQVWSISSSTFYVSFLLILHLLFWNAFHLLYLRIHTLHTPCNKCGLKQVCWWMHVNKQSVFAVLCKAALESQGMSISLPTIHLTWAHSIGWDQTLNWIFVSKYRKSAYGSLAKIKY